MGGGGEGEKEEEEERWGNGGKEMHGPAGEGVRALEVEPVALLDVALAVAPFVNTVFKVWGEDLHGCTRHQH